MEEDLRHLQKAAKKNNHTLVIKYADKVLLSSPGHEQAVHCKYLGLLQLDDFTTAMGLFQEHPEHCKQYLFEYCYMLYRAREDAKARQILLTAPDNAKTAVSLYEQLIRRLDPDQDPLLLNTNLLACYVSAGFPDKAVSLAAKMRERKELSYEASYNMACALLDLGQLKAAQECLAQAEQKCLQGLQKHQADEETTQDELAVLVVQMAFVLQLLHKPKEANDMYLKALGNKPSDEAVVATANNNLITLRRQGEKVFDALKRSERTLKVPAHKLATRQLRAFRLNHCLLLVYGKKGEKVEKQVEDLQQEFSDSEMPILVLAALYFRQKNYGKCNEVLQNAIRKNPEGALQARLTLAHIALSRRDLSSAVEALRSITQVVHRPAVVATLVALYMRDNKVGQAVQALDLAIQHWSRAVEGSPGDTSSREQLILQSLLERAAELCHEQKLYAKACEYYERLLAHCGKDFEDARRYRAALVVNAARADPEDPRKALEYAQALPSPQDLKLEVSVSNQLDPTTIGALRADRRNATNTQTNNHETEIKSPAKKRRKRQKPRFPKGFDPANPGPPPDPERWMPRWERSSFQKRNKKRGLTQKFKGFQGGVVNNSLDASSASFQSGGPPAIQATQVNEAKAKAAAVSRFSTRHLRSKHCKLITVAQVVLAGNRRIANRTQVCSAT
eukprot:g45037.t1